MNDTTYALIIMTLFLIGGIGLGWAGNELYKDYTHKKTLDGLWISGANYSEARSTAYGLDDSNQWVLINVDDDMNYTDCVQVASHECGHELWSKLCQIKDSKLCKEGQELINNYSIK